MPLLILVTMFIFGKKRDRLNTDIAFARARAAFKNSRKLFKLAESAMKKGEARDFYDSLMKGINTYLAGKLNRQLGGIDAAVADELEEKGIKEKERGELKALYHTANEVMFSSLSAGPEKLKQDFKTANRLIARLEKIL